jgi:NAD(P)H dehydrogenase (quinone)
MSTDLPTLAVTGSTGALGGGVARRLASSDVPQRLLAREPGRVPRVDGGVPVEFAGYHDLAGSARALEGVTTLFMVSAAESANRLEEHQAFVDAAAEAGVRHIIYTSFHGAAPDSTFTLGRDHYRTEEHIRASGMDWTFLRDNFYLDFFPEIVGEDGVIRGPAGDGLVAAVSRDDIAASAAAVLAEPGAHVGMSYALTGPEALSMATIAETLTVGLGREVRYHDETVEEAYESRKRWPAPDWQYDAWVSTYTAIAAGEVAEVTHHVLTLTGRPPASLAQVLERR